MSIASVHRPALTPEEQLHNGDRMSRQEFHRLYEKTPDGFRAELVGGIVYAASPLKRRRVEEQLEAHRATIERANRELERN